MIFHLQLQFVEPAHLFITAQAGAEQVTASVPIPPDLLRQGRSLSKGARSAVAGSELAQGEMLARLLLSGPVRELLRSSVQAAQARDERLQLALEIADPTLALLPWEWLTLNGRQPWSPALLDDYGLVRSVTSPALVRWSLPRKGPLRVLIAGAEGQQAHCRAIATALRRSLSKQELQMRSLASATVQGLREELRRWRPQILHLVAPCALRSNGQAQLLLEAEGPILGLKGLSGLVEPQPQLGLIIIDGDRESVGQFSGAAALLALRLAASSGRACVAWHSPPDLAEAATFAHGLYGALAGGEPPHVAATVARRLLAETGAIWGMPLIALPEQALQPLASAAHQPAQATGWPLRISRPLAVVAASAAIGLLLALSTAMGFGQGSASTERTLAGQITLPTPTMATPVEVPEQYRTPSQLIANLPPVPVPLAWATHVVAEGETVHTIAAALGSDPLTMANLNRVGLRDALVPGRALVVPVYRVAGASAVGLDVDIGRQDVANVALTFDIEINDVMLYQILDILRERNLYGTFFVTGRWVEAYPDAARAIVNGGHEIANHSLSHPMFTSIGLEGAVNELTQTEQLVVQTTGVTSRPFFRFPYGDKNPQMLKLLAEQGYISYHWSADDNSLANWMQSVAEQRIKPNGAILLMHQRPDTIAALPGYLDRLLALGIAPVPLSQVLR